MCDIDVAISFLMLALVTTKAVDEEEEIWRTISSSFWAHIWFFSFVLTKLKEKQSENCQLYGNQE